MWRRLDNEYHFDSGNEWLVTNLTQELSAGLEDPSLLPDSIFDCDERKPNLGDDLESLYSCSFVNECVKSEIDDDVEIYDPLKREQCSSSGSETSSVEPCWTPKDGLDTPPTTPPNVEVHPESICVIAGSDVAFVPIGIKGISTTKNKGGRPKVRVKTIVSKASESNNNAQEFLCGELGSASLLRVDMSKEDMQKQQARRRQERMIRNRESAYLSRKRAKEHVTLLEKQVHNLTLENSKLIEENVELRNRLSKYEPVPLKQPRRRLPVMPKKTTALLAIAVTVCINLHSFSLFDEGVGNTMKADLVPTPTNHHGRSLLWVDPLDDASLSNLSTSCPVAINQSESMRLERELRQWIVGGGESTISNTPALFAPGQQRNSSGRKKRIPRARRPRPFQLDVWDLKPSMLGLAGLYEAIHRRDDTFYLVSFSADHLLLPAMASNVTSRPKMSVMLPAFLANSSAAGGGQVEMMQIDCEVTNTQLLSVRDDDIPSHLRHVPKFSNNSVKTVVDEKGFPSYPLAEDPTNVVMNLSKRRQSHSPTGNSSLPLPVFVSTEPTKNMSHGSKSPQVANSREANITDAVMQKFKSPLISQTVAITQKPKQFTSRLSGLFHGKKLDVFLSSNSSDEQSAREWQTNYISLRPVGN